MPAPEGTIAYVRYSTATTWIETHDLATGRTSRLTKAFRSPIQLSGLEWSSTGRRLAFRMEGGSEPGLYTVGSDGNHSHRWQSSTIDRAEHWAWSPAMRALALVAPAKGPTGDACSVPPSRLPIDLVHADGRHRVVQALHAAKPETVDEIGWHRSGESLWVVVSRWGVGHGEDCDWTTQRLVTIDLPSGRRTVVAHGESIGYPTWSSDGRRLAFWDLSTGRPRVVVVRLDGRGGPEPEERVVDFAWTPDGRNLVVGGFGVLGVKPAAGGTLRVLVRGPTSSTLPIAAVSADWIALPSERGYTFVSLAGSASKRVRLDPRRTNVPAPISLR